MRGFKVAYRINGELVSPTEGHPGAPKASRPPPLYVEGWGHARPQRPRAPATAGPHPGLAEAGAGPGVVEGGCQPVLACRCF